MDKILPEGYENDFHFADKNDIKSKTTDSPHRGTWIFIIDGFFRLQ